MQTSERTKPEISVIICAHNAGRNIARALESVFRQSLDDSLYEILLCDDASSDGSLSVMEQLAGEHDNMRLSINTTRLGYGACRNNLLRQAHGDYITILETNDTLEPDGLESLLFYANGPADIIYGNKLLCHESGRSLARLRSRCADIAEAMLRGQFAPACCGALYRREFLVANGIAFSDAPFERDMVFAIRAALCAGSVFYTDYPVYNAYQMESAHANCLFEEIVSGAVDAAQQVKVLLDSDYGQKYAALCDIFQEGLFATAIQYIDDYAIDRQEALALLEGAAAASGIRDARRFIPAIRATWPSGQAQAARTLSRDAVIFVADVAGHVRNFAPIIRELQKLSIPSLVLDASARNGRPVEDREMAPLADLPLFRLSAWDSSPILCPTALAYVFANENINTRPYSSALRRLGIPVLAFYEGLQDDGNVHRPKGYGLPYRACDHLFLPGDYHASIYKKVPHTVAGLPHVRALHQEQPRFPEKALALINCNFSYGVLAECGEFFARSAAEACCGMGLDFHFSQHPADKTDLSAYPLCRVNVYDAIRNSSLLISRFSTCIFEALALGKPVIYHNPHDEKFPTFQIDNFGAFAVTRDGKELASALRRVLEEIEQGVDFRSRAVDYLHLMTNVLSPDEPARIAAEKIAEIVRASEPGRRERLMRFAESTPIDMEPRPVASIIADDSIQSLRDAAERLRGREVYFWGCGSLYQHQKHLFVGAKPLCILVDSKDGNTPDHVDELPVKHPDEVLPCGKILPIVVFVQNVNKVYQTIKTKYSKYTDIVFCNILS